MVLLIQFTIHLDGKTVHTIGFVGLVKQNKMNNRRQRFGFKVFDIQLVAHTVQSIEYCSTAEYVLKHCIRLTCALR